MNRFRGNICIYLAVALLVSNTYVQAQYLDSETGLHYNGARYYEPKTGRYLSSDPIRLQGGMNTYAYANNNPLRYIDPYGLRVTLAGHIAASPAGRITKPNSYHLAIHLDPDDKCNCKGNWPMTVGGQKGNDKLVSAYNYPGDAIGNATFTQVVPTPSGMTDCEFIKNILKTSFRYSSNLDYSLPHISPVPFVRDGYMPPGAFNSNSYVSGVLSAAGVPPPVLNTGGQFQVPGYANPIPMGGR